MSNSDVGIKVAYTYTESGKPSTVTVTYPYPLEESYTDTFNYNIWDTLKSVTRTFSTGNEVIYSAKFLTTAVLLFPIDMLTVI